ncbi:hypothetical protein LOK49_LG11G00660 [Camellia lanceoleosa]|uniref:Uncharacterized protein n=1 Tax=Camellia lanceoleosa TaxID=1840588 RepID=A0ACC0FYV6_9ERIC|nr:hypothetical protein LOK49_LG11G00660 [Camellia lanceoleosa]
MLEAYKGLDYVIVYVENGVDPIMVLSSNGELLSNPNGAEQGGNAIGGGNTKQGGNAICGGDTDIIDINLSDIDIIVDDIGNDSDNSQTGREGSKKSSQNQARKNQIGREHEGNDTQHEKGLQHTTDTESVENNETDKSDSAQSETEFLADEERIDSGDSEDLDYIVSEEYSDTKTSVDSKNGACGFFSWYDPPTFPRGRQVLPKLVDKVAALEECVN